MINFPVARITMVIVMKHRNVFTVMAFAIAFMAAPRVSAEELCSRVEVRLSGYLSNTATIRSSEAVKVSKADEPEMTVVIPQEINASRQSFVFRLARVGTVTWIVEGRSPLTGEDPKSPVRYVSPLAIINFNEDGTQLGEQIIKAYLPYADDDQRKAEFVLSLGNLVMGPGEAKVTVDESQSSSQDCPAVGKTLVSIEEAKSPEHRLRIYDQDGRDVTGAGYDEFGPLSVDTK